MTTKTKTANKAANKAANVAEYIRRIHDAFESIYGADEQLTAWGDIKAHSTEAVEADCYAMRDAGVTVPAKRAGNSEGAKPNLRDMLFNAMPTEWSVGHRQNVLSMMAAVINGKRGKFAKNWTAGAPDKAKQKGAPTTSMVAIPKAADDLDAANLLLKLFEKMQQDTTKMQREFAAHMVQLLADAGYKVTETDETNKK